MHINLLVLNEWNNHDEQGIWAKAPKVSFIQMLNTEQIFHQYEYVSKFGLGWHNSVDETCRNQSTIIDVEGNVHFYK